MQRRTQWSNFLTNFILFALPLERIPSYDVVLGEHSITLRLSQLAGLALIAVNLPLLWRRRGDWLKAPWRWLLLFALLGLLSAQSAVDVKRALFASAFIAFVIILAWTISLSLERQLLGRYLKWLLLGCAVSLVFGLYQFFGDLIGLPNALTGLRLNYVKEIFGFPRVQSTGLEPLYFANYLLLPISISIAYFLRGSRRLRWFAMAALTLLWMTVSRGAYAGVIATTLVLLVLMRAKARQVGQVIGMLVLSAGLGVGLIAYGGSVDKKDSTSATHNVDALKKQATNVSFGESVEGRALSRKLALEAWKTHPLFGVGPGNFGHYAHDTQPDRVKESEIVNNETLEILAEQGAIGLLSLLFFMFSLLVAALRALGGVNRETRLWTYGLLAALAGILVQYQTFSTFYVLHIWVAIGLLAGIAIAPDEGKLDSAKISQ